MNIYDKKWIISLIVTLFHVVDGASGPVYKYLGCYHDAVGSGRDLNGRDLTMSTLSLESCAIQCQSAGYPYCGMQMVNQCFCGTSYGYLGPSTDCNTTCQGKYCGGYLSNDVYYDVDYSTMSQRELVYQGVAASYDDARMVCISNGGDLATVNSVAISQAVANAAAANGSSATSVWIGLRQRLTSGPYEWCDETNAVSYALNANAFTSFWMPNDPVNPCVKMNLPSQKWQSVDCATALPFICLQLPPPADVSNNDQTTVIPPTPASNSNQLLALYIVLPIFALCYGGSCLFYCIHKIYSNCFAKKEPAKMSLDRVEVAESMMNPVRPKVYQPPPPMAAPMSAMPLPAKDPLATAFYVTAPMKPAYQYQSTIDSTKLKELPKMTKADYPPQPGFTNPTPAAALEDKRARMLQNAAMEARSRRPPKEEEAKEKTNAETIKSTAQLLDADDDPDAPDMSSMSIKEILQLKLDQKRDKKKKRGIIST